MTSTEGRRLQMKIFYPTVVLFGIWTASLAGAPKPPKTPAPPTTPKPKATAPPASGQIKFIDLVDTANPTKPQLPYGQEFTIQGNTNEVCIGGESARGTSGVTCGSGHLLSDIIDATDVQVEYTGGGKNSAKLSGGERDD